MRVPASGLPACSKTVGLRMSIDEFEWCTWQASLPNPPPSKLFQFSPQGSFMSGETESGKSENLFQSLESYGNVDYVFINCQGI